jgi:SAM-dependent methyltransferase
MGDNVTLVDADIEFETSRWGSARLPMSDLNLLAKFSGLGEDECLARLREAEPATMASAWRRASPTTPSEIRRFYSRAHEYVWELLAWNASQAYEPYLSRLARLKELLPPEQHPCALDYGSGVGTAALLLAGFGYHVTIADVPGPTLDFARERLNHRGFAFEVVEVREDVPDLRSEGWDVITSFDVLEHVVDPVAVSKALVRALAPGGGAAVIASFGAGDEHPHHLTSGIARFAEHRWPLFFQMLGMKHVGSDIYVKLGRAGTLVRRIRYALWRATGIYVERLER